MGSALRVGIVVTDSYWPGDYDNDTGPLIEALARRDVAAEPVVWHSGNTEGFDLLVLRSPWDYPQRAEEFRSWLERTCCHVPVLNSGELIAWNLDKLYLKQLAERGVPLIPTSWAATEEQLLTALSSALTDQPTSWVVIKPSLSAGANDTELLRADSPAARELGRRILDRGRTVMVQPEVPELSQGREKALYFIDGQHTHTISKGALLERGGGFRGGAYREDPQLVDASAGEIDFGEQVLQAVIDSTGTPMPLYARIDAVDSSAFGMVLLEAELFEPALNLHRAPQAAEALATAIVHRLGVPITP